MHREFGDLGIDRAGSLFGAVRLRLRIDVRAATDKARRCETGLATRSRFMLFQALRRNSESIAVKSTGGRIREPQLRIQPGRKEMLDNSLV
jgi:hypothetical protein